MGPRNTITVLPVTLLALQDEVVLSVRSLTERTANQAAARPAQAVVTLPITVQARGGGATLHAPHTPEERGHR